MAPLTISKLTNSFAEAINVSIQSPEPGAPHHIEIGPDGQSVKVDWSGCSLNFEVNTNGVTNHCEVSVSKTDEIEVSWPVGEHKVSYLDKGTFHLHLHRSFGPSETDGIVVVGSLDIDDLSGQA